MGMDVLHSNHDVATRFRIPPWLHEHNGSVTNVHLGAMAPHPDTQRKTETIAEPFSGYLDIRIDKLGNHSGVWNRSILQHFGLPRDFDDNFAELRAGFEIFMSETAFF